MKKTTKTTKTIRKTTKTISRQPPKRLAQTIVLRGQLSQADGSLVPCVISIRDRLREDQKIGVLISSLSGGQTMSAWVDRSAARKLAKMLPQMLEE